MQVKELTDQNNVDLTQDNAATRWGFERSCQSCAPPIRAALNPITYYSIFVTDG